MDEKISVLIPTYNRGHMVGTAIDSILAQTYKNLEIIVYDDGSTDKTSKVLKQYGNKIVAIKGHRNVGCAYARNRLLNAATGIFGCWQDSDDWSNIHRLMQQHEAMIGGAHISMVRGQWARKINDTRWRKLSPPIKRFKKRPLTNASAMFLMSEVIEVPLERSGGGSDADWLQLMKKRYGKPHETNRILYYIRRHSQRIRRWCLNPKLNPEWSARMAKYRK